VLNPDVIALGGIYPRQRARLEPPMRAVIEAEALAEAVASCRIEPAALGEHIGEWSGLAVALAGEHPELLRERARSGAGSDSNPGSGDGAGPNFDGYRLKEWSRE
jgi:hypothetical protein